MLATVFADMMRRPEQGFDAMDPANISPLVAWLEGALVAAVVLLASGPRWTPDPTREVVLVLVDDGVAARMGRDAEAAR